MIGTTRKSLKNYFRKLLMFRCTVVEISTFKNQEKQLKVLSQHIFAIFNRRYLVPILKRA